MAMVASALSDSSRVSILCALMDGRMDGNRTQYGRRGVRLHHQRPSCPAAQQRTGGVSRAGAPPLLPPGGARILPGCLKT